MSEPTTPKPPSVVPLQFDLKTLAQSARQQILASQAIGVLLSDADHNGKLTRQEAQQSHMLQAQATLSFVSELVSHATTVSYGTPLSNEKGEPLPGRSYLRMGSAVIDDRPLLDVASLEQAATSQLAGKIAPGPFHLPKGAAKVMLSDFCVSDGAFICQKLPHHKLLLMVNRAGPAI